MMEKVEEKEMKIEEKAEMQMIMQSAKNIQDELDVLVIEGS